jgi:NitT/TauT family transport system ATP-binding protein
MSVDGNGTLLELQGVGKEYGGGGRAFVAVRDVSLKIRPGEFVGLLGPSGCGKSTLLRIITGLSPASSGRVLYRGEPLTGINPHATIVFQTFALYPWLTVQENVEIALKARGLPPDERRAVALRLIDLVGLDGFESAYPRELSGGMRQKVGFARAMAVEPELLCLDEPFSALDVLSAEALRNELLELWLGRSIPTQAILLVTHNIEEAVLLADRLVIMGKDPGRVLAEMPVGLRYPRHRKDTAFMATLDKVYALVAGPARQEPGAAGAVPGQPAPTKRLPSARINGLAGLMEKVAEEGGRADLHRIGSGLHLELDDLLPVVEAAQLLGFSQVDTGDILLTPLGQAFADASIPARKEIIASRILRHPTIRWIYETLQQDDDRRVAESYFLELLQTEFGESAPAQLETAINWARYAELFAFDDDTDELFLES